MNRLTILHTTEGSDDDDSSQSVSPEPALSSNQRIKDHHNKDNVEEPNDDAVRQENSKHIGLALLRDDDSTQYHPHDPPRNNLSDDDDNELVIKKHNKAGSNGDENLRKKKPKWKLYDEREEGKLYTWCCYCKPYHIRLVPEEFQGIIQESTTIPGLVDLTLDPPHKMRRSSCWRRMRDHYRKEHNVSGSDCPPFFRGSEVKAKSIRFAVPNSTYHPNDPGNNPQGQEPEPSDDDNDTDNDNNEPLPNICKVESDEENGLKRKPLWKVYDDREEGKLYVWCSYCKPHHIRLVPEEFWGILKESRTAPGLVDQTLDPPLGFRSNHSWKYMRRHYRTVHNASGFDYPRFFRDFTREHSANSRSNIVATMTCSGSKSVSPGRVHNSKRDSPEKEDLVADDPVFEETAKRIRLAFPNTTEQFVKIFTRISSDDRDDVERALQQLLDIFTEETKEDGTAVAFIRLCGHAHLVSSMQKHSNCSEIQQWACRIITKLCHSNRNADMSELGGSIGIAASFGVVGVFDRIRHCLQNFQENEAVVETAMTALQNVVVDAAKQMAHFFLESVGIHLLVERMKNFSNNETIQQCGCRIVRYCMQENALTVELLKKAGAVSVVGAVIDIHPDESEACMHAKWILKVVIAGSWYIL